MPEFAPGDVFVDHRIEGLAGRGGMGVVYRATQLGLDRLVALKVIAPALAEDPSFRQRFVAESKAAASIEHPNVIPVYYAGEREGVLFIVMRYVDGPDLRGLVRAEGKLDGERAAHIVAQIGAGLDAAHQHGLVHRDVKPANVLLGQHDHAYLTDFGLTKRTASTDGGLSRTGAWVGTLGYVAPEQIRGERIDARTDVYALGCVLVFALTGQGPYVRESDEATLWAHLNAPPPSEAVPPQFEGVVARALAKDPSDRYLSAGDLGRAALAAAGRSALPGPERNVARGAAAPPGAASGASATLFATGTATDEGETRPSPRADGELRTAATAKGGGPPPRGSPSRAGALALIGSKRAIAGAGAALLAAGVAVILLLGGGDKPPTKTKPTATTSRPPQRPTATAEPPVFVGGRPNSLTIARGRVWTLTGAIGEIQTLEPLSGERARVGIGYGGKSIAAGLHSIWAVKGLPTRSLLQISQRSRHRLARTAIATPGEPVIVTTGAGAVWVGVRGPGKNPMPETVVRISPGTLGQQAIDVPGGVQYIAVGEGALWVSQRFSRSVLRIKLGSLAKKVIPVDGLPQGISVGEGAVWVGTRGNDTITRINPRSGETKPIDVDYSPTQLAVGGGSVWATARDANRLIRVDPKRRRVIDNIETGNRPFALDVTKGSSVWLTLVKEGSIQRVKFTR
jgi:streptogramin lyase/predicted Ser/Thr protein kinase